MEYINKKKIEYDMFMLEEFPRQKRMSEEKRRNKLEESAKKGLKRVIRIDDRTNEVLSIGYVWEYVAIGCYCASAISQCCNGKRKTHMGCKWKYVEE